MKALPSSGYLSGCPSIRILWTLAVKIPSIIGNILPGSAPVASANLSPVCLVPSINTSVALAIRISFRLSSEAFPSCVAVHIFTGLSSLSPLYSIKSTAIPFWSTTTHRLYPHKPPKYQGFFCPTLRQWGQYIITQILHCPPTAQAGCFYFGIPSSFPRLPVNSVASSLKASCCAPL